MAKVSTTNADQYLSKFAPVFAFDPKRKVLYSGVANIPENMWRVYRNGELIAQKLYDPDLPQKFLAHREMLIVAQLKIDDPDNHEYNLDAYIRGRISPAGEEIFVHDLLWRNHIEYVERNYGYYVNKAVDAVYKYMAGVLN